MDDDFPTAPNEIGVRQLSMYLGRTLTDAALAEIGAYFGGRDRSTIAYACHWRRFEGDCSKSKTWTRYLRRMPSVISRCSQIPLVALRQLNGAVEKRQLEGYRPTHARTSSVESLK